MVVVEVIRSGWIRMYLEIEPKIQKIGFGFERGVVDEFLAETSGTTELLSSWNGERCDGVDLRQEFSC